MYVRVKCTRVYTLRRDFVFLGTHVLLLLLLLLLFIGEFPKLDGASIPTTVHDLTLSGKTSS